MMIEKAKLTAGIDYNNQTYYDYSLKPITLAQELVAIDELDAYNDATTAKAADTIETLIYITKMIEIPGINADVITVDFLLNHLAALDYNNIIAAVGRLNAKFAAAGHAAATAASSSASAVA